jgi:carbon monoxide dehydrogenase subunit G
MTRIESDKTLINKSPSEVFSFLSDFNNYKSLMPEQVVDWKSTNEECSFTIKGMASLGMKIKEKKPTSEIIIVKNGKAPFDFELHCVINPSGENQNQCFLQLFFDADLNPLLKMMAEKPLKNFLNLLVKKYKINSEANSPNS